MLSCLLAPTQGEAWIDGHSILSDALGVKRLIGVVPQEIALYPAISAHENLAFWGHLYGLGGARLKERIAAVLECRLAGSQRSVGTFSGGSFAEHRRGLL
jgi:ABC-2 type transport system ATP-binding protein